MSDEDSLVYQPEPHLWPDVPRIVFGPGDPFDRIVARVDWVVGRPDSLLLYAEGYKRAADALFDWLNAEENRSPGNADVILFPLVFLWRHHAELALKDIISRGRRLDGGKSDFPTHHRVLDLWKEALPHIHKTGDPNAPEVVNVEHNIQEIEQLDPGSFTFRYPTTKAGATNLPSNMNRISLRHLHKAMGAVAAFFDGVISVQMEHEQWILDHEGEP